MCNVRNWTLRKQITVFFVVSTGVFLILLSLVVAINLNIMYKDTQNSAQKILNSNTKDNMGFIVKESGTGFLNKINLLASLNSELNQLLEIAQGKVSTLSDISVQAQPVDPTFTYADLLAAFPDTFQQSTLYSDASVSYKSSVIYYPNPTAVNANPVPTGKADLDAFVTSSASLNKYLPSIFSTERAKKILYVNFYYNQNDLEVLRIYPAYNLPSTYQPKDSTWYKETMKFTLTSDTEWVKIIGPYLDTGRTESKLIAISLPLKSSANALIGALCVEFLTDDINDFINSVSFLNTGEAVVLNNAYQIIAAPTSWGLDAKTISTVSDENVKKLLGSDVTFLEGPSEDGSETSTAPDTVSRVISATDTTSRSYYLIKAYFDTTTSVTSNWVYAVLLYTQVEDADRVSVMLDDLMMSDMVTIIIISLIAIILTLLIVACVSFGISTQISRPLIKLMEFSDLVNKNNANKTLANKYFQGMDNDENLIGELIQVYKNVIGVSAEPTKSRYSAKSQTVSKEEIEYPLNQFHSDFISKTEGESPINWKHLIEQIHNDPKVKTE